MSLQYRAELTPDDNGTVLITAPAFPELTTFAESDERAAIEAVFVPALEEAIAARIARAEDIPEPDDILDTHASRALMFNLTALTTLKVELYGALLASNLNRQQLSKALGWHREQVDRLFRLDHQSRLDQIEAAARVLGYRIGVGLRSVQMLESGQMRTHTNNVDTTPESLQRARVTLSSKRALARILRGA